MPKCCRKSFHLNDNTVRFCLQTHSINQKEKFPTLIVVNFSEKKRSREICYKLKFAYNYTVCHSIFISNFTFLHIASV